AGNRREGGLLQERCVGEERKGVYLGGGKGLVVKQDRIGDARADGILRLCLKSQGNLPVGNRHGTALGNGRVQVIDVDIDDEEGDDTRTSTHSWTAIDDLDSSVTHGALLWGDGAGPTFSLALVKMAVLCVT